MIDLTVLSNEELTQLIKAAQEELEKRTAAADPEKRMVKFSGIRIANGTSGECVLAKTPYHPGLLDDFRQLNGKWQASNEMWRFDKRDEERVREIVCRVLGTDGSQPVEVRDVEIVLVGKDTTDQQLFALGREIVSRPGRDSRVRLGEGVTVIEGSFTSSGGSRNHPAIMRYGEEPVKLLVRDVPVALAQSAANVKPDIFRIV